MNGGEKMRSEDLAAAVEGERLADDLEAALLTAANTRGFGSDMFVWSRLVNAGLAAVAALRATQARAEGEGE